MFIQHTSKVNWSVSIWEYLTSLFNKGQRKRDDKTAMRSWQLLKCQDGSVLALLKCTDGFVLAFLKSTEGSVLALLRLPSIFSCQNSIVGEFWCTMAIMKEKQQNFLFEIEWGWFPQWWSLPHMDKWLKIFLWWGLPHSSLLCLLILLLGFNFLPQPLQANTWPLCCHILCWLGICKNLTTPGLNKRSDHVSDSDMVF